LSAHELTAATSCAKGGDIVPVIGRQVLYRTNATALRPLHEWTGKFECYWSPAKGGTLISFKHSGFGLIPEEVRTGVEGGWSSINERVRKNTESRR